MKKLLLSLVLILAVAITATAQRRTVTRTYKSKCTYTTSAPRPRPSHPYNDIGEIRLHIGGELGVGDPVGLFWHKTPRHYSVGAMAEVQAGRILSLGLGTEFYGSKFSTDNHYNYSYINTVPVYGNIRLSTPGWGTKCYVEARIGYAIPTNQINAYGSSPALVAKGFYTGAGIGLSCFGNNLSVGFNTIDLDKIDDAFTDFYIRYTYAFPLN